MKMKLTTDGFIKLKLNKFEITTMLQVLSHVALGEGPKSGVIMDLLESYETVLGKEIGFDDISVITEIDNGKVSHTIVI